MHLVDAVTQHPSLASRIMLVGGRRNRLAHLRMGTTADSLNSRVHKLRHTLLVHVGTRGVMTRIEKLRTLSDGCLKHVPRCGSLHRWHQCGSFHRRHQDGIDHVDHAVGRIDVCRDQARRVDFGA